MSQGLCECGCGEETRIAQRTARRDGMVAGQPLRFIKGHNRRLSPVEYVVDGNGCWVWQRCRSGRGYGVTAENGRTCSAHRFYYEQAHGPIPEGLTLDHLCRNRAGVNPDHLEPVTNAENCRRGHGTKLTVEQVREIRASPESGADLAHRFGVDDSTVRAVRRGRSWRQEAA